ncbi:flavodoxin-dependent (E)-4-hydroxy-3-methylbut-2-enyl-diphosphate synthase, partial [Candidatus Pelagibacter communis]|uniref:flavodoxin-dependent (E)-4-hydroxy-3-methylbut-2-enyl-diphosphate synthase n=1 Tax=Pelagibacter ubique TaxID=198252 RepID=UPI000A9054D6
RLLVNRMDSEGMDYPLHLGVTEAGEGEDGRIKSAVGIGTLLEDGLGDTIRVSLTEEPEYEIPVANLLVDRYEKRKDHASIPNMRYPQLSPFEYKKRETNPVKNIGGDYVPRVVADLSLENKIQPESLVDLGYTYFQKEDKWGIGDFACDYIFINKQDIDFSLPGTLGVVQAYSVWKNTKKSQHYPFLDTKQYLKKEDQHSDLNFIYVTLQTLNNELIEKIK